ncbi:unnamed protein product [Effrenium voratum]|uniref:EF-hand domain-containing protein n=1 Tax=Effrenium voratum TaxID=2562239 RepID=A0AA36JD66_9DINO|nr:unnamed protein product [Effrenium voratum]CAJ1446011.1 unnamed protein product [Effrenium voratum]
MGRSCSTGTSRATSTHTARRPTASRSPGSNGWFPGFDLFFAILVISNSVLIGVEVQLSLSGPSSLGMRVAQYVYTAFFIVELLLRVLAHGCGSFFCGEDWSWAWFDFFIVMSSAYEVITDLVGAMEDESGISGATALRALRVVRVARVVKTLRVVRIFRFVFALRTLVTSILSTLKSLFWALVLLGLIMYIFAVLFTQAVNDHLVDPDSPSMEAKELMAAHNYYGSLFDTMLSLFMSICGGVSWEDVIAPLKVISVLWTIIYVFYIAFVYFAVLNVITAVFCESAIESAQNDHAVAVQTVMAHKEVHLRKIRALFEKLGGGDMGVITYANFEEGINSQAVREYFETIGLDVLDAWTLFNLLDLDAGGSISVEEFFNGCLRLRGNAKSIDLAKIMHDQSWLVRNHGRFQTHMELEVQQLKEQITKLIKMSSGLGIREAKV